MIKAVFLDLDNTLLHNPDRRFSAAFRQQFDRYFSSCFSIEDASTALRTAIRAISSDSCNNATNTQVMLDSLSAALSLSRAETAAALASFYDEDYNELKALTAPVSKAEALVERLLNENVLVAIATNPLYPESAILKRIEWAGLSNFVCEFAFVTNSDNVHFAKPCPAYFAETVARVGIEPDEALVVGDSLINDIDAARAIGLHTWQVNSEIGLDEIYEHIETPDWRNKYMPRQLNPDMIFPQLHGNLAALYGLLAEVEEHQWLQRPDPNEWSILQILCHLWQTELAVHQNRLRTILEEDNPFLPALPPPGPDIAPCHSDAHEVMRMFRRDRGETIKLLSRVTPAQWERPARHSIFGLTNLLEMAHFTAQHDRLHVTQLCQTLGKCAD